MICLDFRRHPPRCVIEQLDAAAGTAIADRVEASVVLTNAEKVGQGDSQSIAKYHTVDPRVAGNQQIALARFQQAVEQRQNPGAQVSEAFPAGWPPMYQIFAPRFELVRKTASDFREAAAFPSAQADLAEVAATPDANPSAFRHDIGGPHRTGEIAAIDVGDGSILQHDAQPQDLPKALFAQGLFHLAHVGSPMNCRDRKSVV